MDITLVHPWMLTLLFPLVILFFFERRRKRFSAHPFSSLKIVKGAPRWQIMLSGAPHFFVAVSLVLAIVAITEPLGKDTVKQEVRKGFRGILSIDVSGSMTGTPLDTVKKAASSYVLHPERKRDIFGIVPFDSKPKFSVGTRVTASRDLVVRTIDNLTTHGATSVGNGLIGSIHLIIYDHWRIQKLGDQGVPEPTYEDLFSKIEELLEESLSLRRLSSDIKTKYGEMTGDYIILLTDEESYSGIPTDVAVQFAVFLEIPVYLITVGVGSKDSLVRLLVESGGGVYRADNTKEIEKIYTAINTRRSTIVEVIDVPIKFSYGTYIAYSIAGLLALYVLLSLRFPRIE